ncbi:hypothetical protein HGM15179_021355, partial [Zosterops borbonicus]
SPLPCRPLVPQRGPGASETPKLPNCSSKMIPRRFLGNSERSATEVSGLCLVPVTFAPRSWWPSRKCPTGAERPV